MKFKTKEDPYKHRLTSYRDVKLRYNNTVVLLDDQPVFVVSDPMSEEGEGFDRIRVYKFKKTRFSEEFSCVLMKDRPITTNFKFGWTKWAGRIFHVSRSTNRSYLQGMNRHNTLIDGPSIYDKEYESKSLLALAHIGAFDLIDKVQEEYESGSQKEGCGYVLSRDVAIIKEGEGAGKFNLYLGMNWVGVYDIQHRSVTYNQDNFYSVGELMLIDAGLI